MSAIAKHGSEEQKQEWLPRMARGEAIGCFGLTEPQGGSDPAGMTTIARRDGSGDGADWIIDGAKRWIGLASVAEVAVIWAQTDDGVRGFLVPTDTPGFTATPIAGKLSMRASIQCDISLDGGAGARRRDAAGRARALGSVRLPQRGALRDRVGRDGRGALVPRGGDRAGRRSREVFGRPIGANQLIQAKLADMAVEYEKGMLLALHLGRLKDRGVLTPAQISVGKLNSVREALDIAREARAILGGDGVTNEFPVMRHLANLESVRTYEGTDEIHQLVIGRALTGLNAF